MENRGIFGKRNVIDLNAIRRANSSLGKVLKNKLDISRTNNHKKLHEFSITRAQEALTNSEDIPEPMLIPSMLTFEGDLEKAICTVYSIIQQPRFVYTINIVDCMNLMFVFNIIYPNFSIKLSELFALGILEVDDDKFKITRYGISVLKQSLEEYLGITVEGDNNLGD